MILRFEFSVQVPKTFSDWYMKNYRTDSRRLTKALSIMFAEHISEPFHRLDEDRLKYHLKRTPKEEL